MLRIRIFAFALLSGAAVLLIGCGSTAQSVVPTYALGDHAQAGPLIYTAFDTRWLPQLETSMMPRIPANRFFLVRLSVVNSGSSEVTVPTLTISDEKGQSYQELSDGDGVPQWVGYVRQVKPAETLSGNVLFDAPPQHYKLEVTDESQAHKALIDIPLSFASEAPVDVPGAAIPQPQSPK